MRLGWVCISEAVGPDMCEGLYFKMEVDDPPKSQMQACCESGHRAKISFSVLT